MIKRSKKHFHYDNQESGLCNITTPKEPKDSKYSLYHYEAKNHWKKNKQASKTNRTNNIKVNERYRVILRLVAKYKTLLYFMSYLPFPNSKHRFDRSKCSLY
jgi:hypothetical protein